MSNANYINLRIRINIENPENKKMMQYLDSLTPRARNRYITDAIKKQISGPVYDAIAPGSENVSNDIRMIMEMVRDMDSRLVKLEKQAEQVSEVHETCVTQEQKLSEEHPFLKTDEKQETFVLPQEFKKSNETQESPEEYDVPEFALNFIDSLQ